MRSMLYSLVTIVLGVVVCSAAITLAQQSKEAPKSTTQQPSTSSTSTEASQAESFMVGLLEITPIEALLRLSVDSTASPKRTYFSPTIRFKIRNTSASDLKLILMRFSILATDDLGLSLFTGSKDTSYAAIGGGITLSDLLPEEWGKVFEKDKNKFINLSPKQVFQAQLTRPAFYLDDPDLEIFKGHKPKSLSFSASIAVTDLSGNTLIHGFSFDVSVKTNAGK